MADATQNVLKCQLLRRIARESIQNLYKKIQKKEIINPDNARIIFILLMNKTNRNKQNLNFILKTILLQFLLKTICLTRNKNLS